MSKSPIKLIIILGIGIFIAELCAMFIVHTVSGISNLMLTILNPLLFLVLLSPVLYFLILKPMLNNIIENDRALNELQSANQTIDEQSGTLKKEVELLNIELENNAIINKKLKLFSRGVEQSANSIVITDVKGNIQYVNPKFCNLTGYSIDELLGKNPRILKLIICQKMFIRTFGGLLPEEVSGLENFKIKKRMVKFIGNRLQFLQ